LADPKNPEVMKNKPNRTKNDFFIFINIFSLLVVMMIFEEKGTSRKAEKGRLQMGVKLPWSLPYGHLLIIPHTPPQG
jgi:hypothetical protein